MKTINLFKKKKKKNRRLLGSEDLELMYLEF